MGGAYLVDFTGVNMIRGPISFHAANPGPMKNLAIIREKHVAGLKKPGAGPGLILATAINQESV